MFVVEDLILGEEKIEYVKLGKEKGFSALENEIILKDLCMSCGLCESICQEEVIKVEEQPSLIGECSNCGDCLIYCPRSFLPIDDGEVLGEYLMKIAARARDERITKVSQDGGFVTALLCYALEKKIIDGAIVSMTTEEWRAEPFIATSIEEIINAAGSKYTPSPNLRLLKGAKERGLKSIALVGLPCHIQGVAKLQHYNNDLAKIIKFAVGLFCKSSFNTSLLREFVTKYNIDLNKVKKLDIKGKYFRVYKNGDVIKVSMKEIGKFARSSCKYCFDFSAKLADFSVGSVGSAEGYSTVIVRSEIANELLNGMIEEGVIETTEVEDELIIKLSETKRKEAKKRVKAKIKEELPLALKQFVR